MTPLVIRWLKFNTVGALGIGVQFACFGLLSAMLRVNYLAATALAVEAAVLHNFAWHERFTWKDWARGLRHESALRLIRFHAATGLVSIVGNLALMRALVGGFHLNQYLATGIAIACCSLLNFAVSEWFVFRI